MPVSPPSQKGLPFFRYSKLCLVEWLASIALVVYGLIKPDYTLFWVGIALFVGAPVINEIFYNLIALCQSEESQFELREKFKNMDVLPIVYSPGYNITACGFEKLHPFDSTKYKRIWQFLHQKGTIELSTCKFWEPELPNRRWLNEVMSKWYLFKHSYSACVCKYVELPLCFLPGWFLRSQLLEPMLLGSKGSVDAACLAMTRGWAINLSGGFHHATRSSGGGFCIFPDITFVSHFLRKYYGIKRIMIVDLDAHQGNGHELDHKGDADTFIIDAYNHRIYPGDREAQEAILEDLSVTYSDSDEVYLRKVGGSLERSINQFRPEFLIYNAGTDCLINDPLGCLGISSQGIIDRDELVFEHCLRQKIPVVMLMSGGYQQSNAQIIADSIENLLTKFNLLKEEK